MVVSETFKGKETKRDVAPTGYVGKSWGATSYTQRKNKKTKIPDSQKDVRRHAKIGAQKIRKT